MERISDHYSLIIFEIIGKMIKTIFKFIRRKVYETR